MLSDGRFRLGLGAGENLNEHIIGGGWPGVDVRHEKLVEAVEIIRPLWDGGFVNYTGKHFEVASAKGYDLPEAPIPWVSLSPGRSRRRWPASAPTSVSPSSPSRVVRLFADAGGSGKPWWARPAAATAPMPDAPCRSPRAVPLVRRRLEGQRRAARPVGLRAASQFVREQDLAEQLPHGPEVDGYVKSAQEFADAGFTELAFVQVGPDQAAFCEWFASTLRPALEQAGLTG